MGQVIWFTGLSGAGKSTIAEIARQNLLAAGKSVILLDGDLLRSGLNADLGFSREDRTENLRRAAHIAKVLSDQNQIVLCCFISPLEEQRQMIKKIVGDALKMVFVKTSLEECERRDPKGLYKRARAGEIPDFTGIAFPFEEPKNPDLVLDTAKHSAEALAKRWQETFCK